MNKSLRKCFLAGLVMMALVSPAFAQSRIATVDLRKVFDGYWKTKQAEGALKERAAELAKEINGLKEDLRKGADDYKKLLEEANDMAVSADERDKRKQSATTKSKELRQLEDSIRQYEGNAGAQIEQQKRRMTDNIVSEIRTVIKARAASGGYNLVMDTAADSVNGTPVVIYSSGDADLTEGVLSQLNANAPLDLKKPAEKATEKK
jgi:outer membrane protein